MCRLHKGGDLRRLSGVVYMTKCRGPRTEPWGTPQRQVCSCRVERLLLHLTLLLLLLLSKSELKFGSTYTEI